MAALGRALVLVVVMVLLTSVLANELAKPKTPEEVGDSSNAGSLYVMGPFASPS